MGPPQRMHATDFPFPTARIRLSSVPSSNVVAHLLLGSVLHCLTGRRHVEQMYVSPSANDSAGGVNDSSVSVAFNFLSVEGSDCLLDFLATDTLICIEQRGDAPVLLVPVQRLHIVSPFKRGRVSNGCLAHAPLHLLDGKVFMLHHPFVEVFKHRGEVLGPVLQQS